MKKCDTFKYQSFVVLRSFFLLSVCYRGYVTMNEMNEGKELTKKDGWLGVYFTTLFP
jgi:hypothetical protein